MAEIHPNNEPFKANAGIGSKFIVYLSFILIIPIILYIVSRNNLLRLQQSIEQTAGDIDVQLKKRFDLLNKLVDATKGYMKYEKSTLTEVVKLRSNMSTMQDYAKANNALTDAFSKFNVLLENYPNLRASENVQQLQLAAKDCEDNIAAARRFYNANIQVFNSKLKTFPSNVVATGLQLISKDYFSATAEERKDVKIDLNI